MRGERQGGSPIEQGAVTKAGYNKALMEFRKEYRGNPGQAEALVCFDYIEDYKDGLELIGEFKNSSLTPWDVYQVYNRLFGYSVSYGDSIKAREIEDEQKGSTPFVKVARYMFAEEKKRGPEMARQV